MKFDQCNVPAPRDGVIGEAAYLSAAIDFVKDKDGGYIFDSMPICNPDQLGKGYWCHNFLRLAMWLGTDVGNEFMRGTSAAAEHIESVAQRQGFWLASWSVMNHRIKSRSRNFTILELLLGTRGEDGFPVLCPGDVVHGSCVEFASHFFFWLGSDDGYAFIVAAETELRNRRAMLAINGPASPMIVEEGMVGNVR